MESGALLTHVVTPWCKENFYLPLDRPAGTFQLLFIFFRTLFLFGRSPIAARHRRKHRTIAQEASWREDRRKLSNGEQVQFGRSGDQKR
jgi:hypothetical protein